MIAIFIFVIKAIVFGVVLSGLLALARILKGEGAQVVTTDELLALTVAAAIPFINLIVTFGLALVTISALPAYLMRKTQQ